MGFSRTSITITLVCFLALAIIHPTSAQNSPQDYVDAHNAVRAHVGVGPVSWGDGLAAYAQNYANQRAGDCALVHSGGQYGENIAVGYSDFSGTAAVNLWAGEKPNYNYDSNSCATGQTCGYYTQIVWRNSVRIGCARVQCNSGAWFITCNYDPPGNVIGEKPY